MKNTRFLIFFGIYFGLLSLYSCGTEESSRLKAKEPVAKPVFFAIGGRSSCKPTAEDAADNPWGSGIYKALKIIMDRIAEESHSESEYFVACHYNGSADLAYVSSWEPTVQSGQSERAVREEILKKRSEINGSQAVLIGHSYGGWIGMSLLSELPENQSFGQLYTLDPISKIDCSIWAPFGCTTAPADIGLDARNHIADKTAVWHNYYQIKTFYLHSSPIDQADGNFLRGLEHTEMDQDSDAWDDIHDNVVMNFRSLMK